MRTTLVLLAILAALPLARRLLGGAAARREEQQRRDGERPRRTVRPGALAAHREVRNLTDRHAAGLPRRRKVSLPRAVFCAGEPATVRSVRDIPGIASPVSV